MADQEHIQDQIDRFLRGKMNAEEQTAFEQTIEQDKALAEEVQDYEAVYQLTQSAGRQQLKTQLQDLESSLQSESTSEQTAKIRPFGSPFSWAAAAAVFLLGVVVWWWFGQQTVDPNALYAEYYSPYRAPINLRSGGAQDLWQQASEAYADGQFAEAANLFGQVEADSLHPAYLIAFYEGMAYLNRESADLAQGKIKLQESLKTESDYAQAARWYLALIDLKEGDSEKAKSSLLALQKEGYRPEQVKALLEEMD